MQDPKTTGLKKRQLIDSAGRTVFMWVAIASVAVSVCVVAIQFLYQQFDFNNKIYGYKTKAASTLATNINSAKELKKEVDSLVGNQDLAATKTSPNDASTKVILDALPGTYEAPALATSLQQTVLTRSGVTIENISVPSTVEPPATTAPGDTPPVAIKFTVVVSGTYDKMTNLFKDLERTIRPMQITNASITGNDALLRATLDITTYYQPSKTVTIKTQAVR